MARDKYTREQYSTVAGMNLDKTRRYLSDSLEISLSPATPGALRRRSARPPSDIELFLHPFPPRNIGARYEATDVPDTYSYPLSATACYCYCYYYMNARACIARFAQRFAEGIARSRVPPEQLSGERNFYFLRRYDF